MPLTKKQKNNINNVTAIILKKDMSVKVRPWLTDRMIEYAMNNRDQFTIVYDSDIVVGQSPDGNVRASEVFDDRGKVKQVEIPEKKEETKVTLPLERQEALEDVASILRSQGLDVDYAKPTVLPDDSEPVQKAEEVDGDEVEVLADSNGQPNVEIPEWEDLTRLKNPDLFGLARQHGIEPSDMDRSTILSVLHSKGKRQRS